MTRNQHRQTQIATIAKIQKSPQRTDQPDSIPATTYRTAPAAIYEDWGLSGQLKTLCLIILQIASLIRNMPRFKAIAWRFQCTLVEMITETRSSKIYEGKILEEQVSQRSCHDTELQGRQERTTGPTRKRDEEKCQHFFAQMHKPTESCLVSKNIQSYGLDKNPKYHQRKGVKQGCPLSPRLFTIVLDDVLRTLEELVSEVRLDQDAEINLPVILSFADDIIIIGDSTTVLTNIMKNLKELLISVGLKLNETKTKMLVRDPINKSIAKQTQEINGVLITPVDTIKYLGTYLTSELSRRDTIKARCKQAIRNAKGLIPFIKRPKCTGKSPS
ncbi:LINE-1 retrotransposable element ORF2 protein [Eumeta japonica]|uniref:LINE-1 retrotransposable element ORF2 protein n=1 Tax=Eumeta variegata TaxID=151549 RepID=A0A4C1ZMG0_EUMVA|nr:LINE-1 retrotransposable element ORF2 protein [Eumeta japonica]